MTYKEKLPHQCPPAHAQDVALKNICRFLPFPEGDSRNFASHRELGKHTGNASECDARSLSLQWPDAVPGLLSAKKTAFFKKMKIALVSIPKGSGRSVDNNRGHVHFWMFANHDPSQHVVSVCETVDEIEQALDDDK